MHLVGTAQALGLFFLVCLAIAAFLSLAMAGLARIGRATLPAPSLRPAGSARSDRRPGRPTITGRVSSPGGCTYGPRGR